MEYLEVVVVVVVQVEMAISTGQLEAEVETLAEAEVEVGAAEEPLRLPGPEGAVASGRAEAGLAVVRAL